MLGDWFRSLDLRVSFEEFERLPRHPAYKYEYYGGQAVITPWPRYGRAVLDLDSLSPPSTRSDHLDDVSIRLAESADWELLPKLLAGAFHGVPPFASLSDDLRLSAAADCVEHTRTGGDGPVIEPACFVAVHSGEQPRLVGAILITFLPIRGTDSEAVRQPHLTWVLVHPMWFRRGDCPAHDPTFAYSFEEAVHHGPPTCATSRS